MASERGTMQRGPQTPENATWAPEATAPAGRRLPSPPRERKPALAALALLLIIGGALGAGFLVIQSSQKVAAIVVTQPVAAGAKIPASALQRADVSVDSGVQYVSWAYAGRAAQDYAAVSIPAGTLLTPGMVATAAAVTHRGDVVGLALKDGQFPPGLTAGNRIAIFATGGQNNGTGCGGAGGLLSGNATVISVASATGSGLVGSSGAGGTDVTVAVSAADAGAVACNAAAGQVAVALLPPGASQPPASQPAAVPGGNGAAGQQSGANQPSGQPSHSPAARTGHG
ncbi:MAG: hypothetical protein ACM32E_08465 [Gemmatimonadota bacterium]